MCVWRYRRDGQTYIAISAASRSIYNAIFW
jgi:hypothetical protein